MDLAAIIISAVALVVSTAVALRQINLSAKANDANRRLLEIEATRHSWEREERDQQRLNRDAEAEALRSANFELSFGYRDSARTWGRVVARNVGPTDARDARLTVWAEFEDGRREVEPVKGQDYGASELVRVDESVHVGVAFGMGTPQPEDLQYTLTWSDDRGKKHVEGKVPSV